MLGRIVTVLALLALAAPAAASARVPAWGAAKASAATAKAKAKAKARRGCAGATKARRWRRCRPRAAAPSAPAAAAAAAPARTTPVVLGAAANLTDLEARPGYAGLFGASFSSLTPENEMKMAALQPRRDEFDFTAADRMVDWALANGKEVHGHTLVFKQQVPGWLTTPTPVERLLGSGAPYGRDELLAIMRKHIATVMRHYEGRVRRWDVVNEALRQDGRYNPGLWLDTIGPEYVFEAFRAARAAVPAATLCYNEIGAEVPGALADATYELVAALRREGLVDCVGFQTHVNAATPPARELVQQNLERFAALGVELHVSEMDVSVAELGGDEAARRAEQARIFHDVALACHRVPACTRFTTWGVTDASTWLGSEARPLPFDDALAPKPAWDAIRAGLAGAPA